MSCNILQNIVSKELDIDNDAGFASCLYEMKVCDGIDPESITEAPVLEIEEEFDSIYENPLLDLKPREKIFFINYCCAIG